MKFIKFLFLLILIVKISTIQAQTSFNISNQTTGDTLFTIDNNGQVGIGTTAPSVDLELRGLIPDDASRVYLTNSDDSHNLFLYSGRENAPNPLISWSATDALRFATFETGLSEIMRLTNAGNLGLGTSDPTSRLDIQMVGNGLWQRAIRVLNPDMVATDGLFLGLGREDNMRNIGFMYFRYDDDQSESNRLSLGLYGVNDVLNVMGSGNVGIGTVAPTEMLEVADTIYSSIGGFKFPDGSVQETAAGGGISGNNLDQAYDQGGPGAGRVITADAGPVGIAGSGGIWVNGHISGSGGQTLSGSGVEGGQLSLLDGDGTGTWIIDNFGGTGNESFRIFNPDGDTPVFNALVIGDTGNVGIKVGGPEYPLDVNGTIQSRSGGFRFPDGTTQTTAATGGGVSSINDLTDGRTVGNSVFLGSGAGISDDGTENRNTAIGINALNSNTTGYNNTANGYQALYSNTFGYYNTATGYNALYSNTTGRYNTAYGNNALISNNGYSNTANGYWALNGNTTGSNNVGVGRQANYWNQEGSNNTIIGVLAGRGTAAHNKSGNVFLGYHAGYNETGDNKLYIENSDSGTPLIGGDFATDQIFLNGSVGIGTSSPSAGLHLVGNGYPNSFMYLESQTAGDAGFRLYEGATDKWHIFNNASLDGLQIYNDNGQNVFFADQSTANVGIGTTNPTTKLEIAGQVKITGGNPGAGRVLTSDANGLATWQASSTYAIGDEVFGGIVFWVDPTGQHGLVCAEVDQGTGNPWSGGSGNFDTEAHGNGIGAGEMNTMIIIATQGPNVYHYAAGLCATLVVNDNGNNYGGWYLPSRLELGLMYYNLHLSGLGGFSSAFYWSSTEHDNNYSWTYFFGNGSELAINKNTDYYVRAVREF